MASGDPWNVLQRGGLPMAGERNGVVPSHADLAAAALEIIGSASGSAREREALGSWLRAWRSHWPTSFLEAFGDDATRVLAWAEAAAPDPDRYLKLRRIALARLAGVA